MYTVYTNIYFKVSLKWLLYNLFKQIILVLFIYVFNIKYLFSVSC